jgi:hypothetical protein
MKLNLQVNIAVVGSVLNVTIAEISINISCSSGALKGWS